MLQGKACRFYKACWKRSAAVLSREARFFGAFTLGKTPAGSVSRGHMGMRTSVRMVPHLYTTCTPGSAPSALARPLIKT